MHRSLPRLSLTVGACLAPVAALLLCAARPSALAAQTLRGSQESVDETYEYARGRGLMFHRTGRTVRRAAASGDLVRLGGSKDYRVKGITYPYVLPATRTFVNRLAGEYREACREAMTVTSAVRPSSRQPRNAVPKSVHPTGLAIDLRKPRGSRCREWLRDRLLELEGEGIVDATEENYPPHFHVVVYSASMRRGSVSSAAQQR